MSSAMYFLRPLDCDERMRTMHPVEYEIQADRQISVQRQQL